MRCEPFTFLFANQRGTVFPELDGIDAFGHVGETDGAIFDLALTDQSAREIIERHGDAILSTVGIEQVALYTEGHSCGLVLTERWDTGVET